MYMDHKRLTKLLTMINFISEVQEAEFSLETKFREENLVNLIFV